MYQIRISGDMLAILIPWNPSGFVFIYAPATFYKNFLSLPNLIILSYKPTIKKKPRVNAKLWNNLKSILYN